MESAMTSVSASRVTHSSRSLRLALLLLAVGLAAVPVLRAQEPPPAEKEVGGAESAGQDGPAASVEPPAQDASPPAPAEDQEPPADPDRKPGVVGPTPGRFEPTEKVRADFDVSFPVDI
jgi:hypothetical protein